MNIMDLGYDGSDPFGNDELITKGEAIRAIAKYRATTLAISGIDEAELISAIETVPPVKAISIDWMKKKYCNKGAISTEKYLIRMGFVQGILKDWRER